MYTLLLIFICVRLILCLLMRLQTLRLRTKHMHPKYMREHGGQVTCTVYGYMSFKA